MFRLSTSCRVAEAHTLRPCGQCTRHWCIGTILNSLPPKDRCILLVSREPLLVFEFEASLFALQYTKPLFEFVLLPERRTQRPRGLSTCLKSKCKVRNIYHTYALCTTLLAFFKNRAAYAALAESEQPLQALTLSLFRFALFLLNELDYASEGKPRAVAGARARSIVIRAAAHEAAVRARAAARAKNTTPTRSSVKLTIRIVCVHAAVGNALAWYHVAETSVFHSGNFLVVAAVGDTLHGTLAAVGHLDMPNCIDRTTCRRNALVLVESIVTRNVQSHVVHPLRHIAPPVFKSHRARSAARGLSEW